ncbi:hypothetical protein ACTZWT_19930 [Rhodopseudomonas sp. NSM]|uniref:hypothetical protein n=1 Tax=Rhodopseudomonas sp. NSM TaxID=3457630 RepID=UPI0040365947
MSYVRLPVVHFPAVSPPTPRPIWAVVCHVVISSKHVQSASGDRPQIFTLEIDGRPVLSFEATDLSEAQGIARDTDLRTDLCALTSRGSAICSGTAMLAARAANAAEAAVFENALRLAPASDEPTMAFLIAIDGVTVISVGPD